MDTKRTTYLIKNLGILTISNFASKILVFLMVPLYTSVLTTEDYGKYDLAVSTANLLFPILTVNIIDAVMRFTMDKKYNNSTVISVGLYHSTLGIAIAGVALVVLGVSDIWKAVDGLELYIFLYFLTHVIQAFLNQTAKGLERIRDMAVGGVISTIVMIAANVLFLIVFKLGLEGFFVANIVAQLIPSVYLFIKLKFYSYIKNLNVDKRLHKEMLGYCVPLIATSLGWWVNSTSDRYVVSFMCGVAANGLLSVSYKIPTILTAIQNIFTQAWQISAVKEYGEKDTPVFYGNTFKIITLLMSLACSILILLTRPLAKILYANDFYNAWKFVPFLLVSTLFNCSSGLLGPILSAKKDSKAMMWSAVIGAGANIVLNILLVAIVGIQGATIATAICSFIIYYIRRRAVGDDIKISNVQNIFITWILVCIESIVEVCTGLWMVECGLIVVIIAINHKTILKIFNSIEAMIHNLVRS